MLKATHGGVTLSGGEPLVQPAFVAQIFRHCRSIGVHTALDTSGFLGARADDALLDDTDLVLLDVKSGLPETYLKVTGRELAPTLAFGRRLAERGNAIWIRYVLVPGLTDAVDNVAAVADYAASLQVSRCRRRGAAGGDPAVPSDGREQVEGPRPAVCAGGHPTADAANWSTGCGRSSVIAG